MTHYDILLIGTGQATGTIMVPLLKRGLRIAIAEGGAFGGTCVNTGCSPVKTLVASARAAHMARRGADFGVNTGDISIDFEKVMARQRAIRNSFSSGLENWLRNNNDIDVYDDYAAFESANSVRVGEQIISADKILIHAGARPRVVPIEGLDTVAWLDNRGLLELDELPRHLMIIGGSYIGLEFAQAFRRFGSEVTVFEAGPQLMFREDTEIAQIAREILEAEGVRIICNAKVQRVSAGENESVAVHYTQDEVAAHVEGSHLLVAVGRVPNSDTLNLSAAGVETNSRGYITVNDVCQTNVPHIYALGDINGRGAFTHTSVNDGEVFLDHLDGGTRSINDRVTTYAMYIDPPLGRVGMSEKEARQSERNILMGTMRMADIARAKEKDETDGIVKVLVDADTEEIVGATVFGVGGDEIVNMFTVFMATGQSYKVFRRTVLNHPTVAELMPWVLDKLQPLT